MMAGKKRKRDFESGLKRLEEIVEILEKGGLSLEESLSLFEEGVNLSRFLHNRLKEAERKIEILKKTESGEFTDIPFEEEDN
jgi:exodeoxyribonuclease VII small subunit